MKAREGDLIQTQDKVIFDIKGLIHPPTKIVAFPRFIPDPRGKRKKKEIAYRKVYALSERYRFLAERLPHYLIFDPVFGLQLCEVPKEDVKHRYDPVNRLQELRDSSLLDGLEANALRFAELLQNQSAVPQNNLGISGSLLAELHTTESDIDPIVYGKKHCLKIYATLRSLMKEGKNVVKAYTREQLRALYNFRSQDTRITFDNFVKTERRKALQGKFLQYDFYVRCVKDWDEVGEYYGDIVYRRVGYATIKAVVSDDSEAIFTPCRYSIDNVQVLEGKRDISISEIVSFRGRFCEQARNGETVIAQGTVERTEKKKTGAISFRLLIGGKPSDFMVLSQ